MLRRCCCWKDLRLASVAAGIFTLVTSVVQILLAILLVMRHVGEQGSASLNLMTLPLVTSLYLVLALLDLVLAVTSGVLLASIERENCRGMRLMSSWLICVPVYVMYEAAVYFYLIYSVLYAYSSQTTDLANALLYLPIPLVYWVTKLFVTLLGYLAVMSRMKQLESQRNGERFMHNHKSPHSKPSLRRYQMSPEYPPDYDVEYPTNYGVKYPSNYDGKYPTNFDGKYPLSKYPLVCEEYDYPRKQSLPRYNMLDYQPKLPRSCVSLPESRRPFVGYPLAYNNNRFTNRKN